MKLTLAGLNTGSMGHLVRDSDIIIRRHLDSRAPITLKSEIVLFYASKNVANSYFLDMLRNHIVIFPHWPWYLIDKFLYKISKNYRSRRAKILEITPDAIAKFSEFQKPLQISQKHTETMNSILWSLKVQKPYVCLVVRDSAYDSLHNPSSVHSQKYRHTPIEYFESSTRTLLKFGYSTVRMGRFSESALMGAQGRVSDYSQQKNKQTDERDIRLFEECSFVLTTVTGPDELGSFFRKKVYRINASPISHVIEASHYPITLLSDYIQIDTNEKLSWSIIKKNNFHEKNADELFEKYKICILPKGHKAIRLFVELVCLTHPHKVSPLAHPRLNDFLKITKTSHIGKGLIY